MSIWWTPCIWNSHGFHLSQEQTSLCIIYETIATDLGLVSLNIYQSQAFTSNSYVPSMTEQLLSYLQSYVMITILQFGLFKTNHWLVIFCCIISAEILQPVSLKFYSNFAFLNIPYNLHVLLKHVLKLRVVNHVKFKLYHTQVLISSFKRKSLSESDSWCIKASIHLTMIHQSYCMTGIAMVYNQTRGKRETESTSRQILKYSRTSVPNSRTYQNTWLDFWHQI